MTDEVRLGQDIQDIGCKLAMDDNASNDKGPRLCTPSVHLYHHRTCHHATHAASACLRRILGFILVLQTRRRVLQRLKRTQRWWQGRRKHEHRAVFVFRAMPARSISNVVRLIELGAGSLELEAGSLALSPSPPAVVLVQLVGEPLCGTLPFSGGGVPSDVLEDVQKGKLCMHVVSLSAHIDHSKSDLHRVVEPGIPASEH